MMPIGNPNRTNCAPLDIMRMKHESELQYWVKGVSILVISIIGICLNTATIGIIFPKKRRDRQQQREKKEDHSIFDVLVVAFFTSDTIFLMIQVLISLLNHILCLSSKEWKIVYMKVLFPLWNIFLANSVFMTVALSIERYISLIHPNAYDTLLERATSRCVNYLLFVVPITIFTVLYHIPSFFINSKMRHIFIMGNTATKCYQYVEKNYDIALYYNHYARLIMEGILPLIVLIYCNLKLHMKVRNNLLELQNAIISRQSPMIEAFPLAPRPQ